MGSYCTNDGLQVNDADDLIYQLTFTGDCTPWGLKTFNAADCGESCLTLYSAFFSQKAHLLADVTEILYLWYSDVFKL